MQQVCSWLFWKTRSVRGQIVQFVINQCSTQCLNNCYMIHVALWIVFYVGQADWLVQQIKIRSAAARPPVASAGVVVPELSGSEQWMNVDCWHRGGRMEGRGRAAGSDEWLLFTDRHIHNQPTLVCNAFKTTRSLLPTEHWVSRWAAQNRDIIIYCVELRNHQGEGCTSSLTS